MKQRNTQYPLKDLQPGDRFYFAGKKKDLYTLHSNPPFFHKIQAGYNIQYANCRPDSDPLKLPIAKKTFHNSRDTRVIFLRNINDKN